MESVASRALDDILSTEKLLTVNKFVDLLSTLDRLGFIDLIRGALNDEELISKVAGGILNDKTLSILVNYKDLTQFVDLLLDNEFSENVRFLMNLVGSLKKSGVIDPVLGMLGDQEFMGKLMSSLVNDKTLQLMQNWDSLLDTTMLFTQRENVESLDYFLGFLNELRKSGFLDPIRGLLKDEETLGKIFSVLINDFTLNLASNWKDIVTHLSSLDLTNFKGYVDLINAAGKAVNSVEYKPVRSFLDILRNLRDPDIQNGLGFLFSMIKEIGKMAKEKNISPRQANR